MDDRTVIYLHGFASSSRGEKAQFLKEKFQAVEDVRYLAIDFNPTPVDFREMTITGMINRLRQFVYDHQVKRPLLIGSSLGGLVSVQYAALYPVEKMLLLAPLLAYQSLRMEEDALSLWKARGIIEVDHFAFPGKLPLKYAFHLDALGYEEMIEPDGDILIIHGRKDERVPVEDSRFYTEKYPSRVRLQEVLSDHRLADQHDQIWELVLDFLITSEKQE